MGADLMFSSEWAAQSRGYKAMAVARELYAIASEPDCPPAIGGRLLRMARELGLNPEGSTGPENFGP